MKLVDVLDSKSSGPCARASSTLASGTKQIGRSEGSGRLFYATSKTWSLGQGQRWMAWPVEIASFYGGFRCRVSGVRKKNMEAETWTLKPEIWCLKFDIFQCSITPADCRKRVPSFMVSRQQFKKYPGLRTDNNGKCWTFLQNSFIIGICWDVPTYQAVQHFVKTGNRWPLTRQQNNCQDSFAKNIS